MYLRIIAFIHLIVLSISCLVDEEVYSSETLSVTTKMISGIIIASERSTILFLNLNSAILENFVRSHDLQITVVLNDLKILSHFENNKITSAILHFGNFDEFEIFFNKIQPGYFSYTGHFLIIYDSDDDGVFLSEKTFSKFWKIYIYNVNILVINSNWPNLVPLFTYTPFANGSCYNTRPVRINEFDRTSMKWTNKVFFPKKFQQLNRCPIRAGRNDNRPHFIIEKFANGTKRFSGIYPDIIVMCSDALNFSVIFQEHTTGIGVLHANKTATGTLMKALNNETDLTFASLQQDRTEVLSVTRPVLEDQTILVVPPPFLIDPMTKILMPFTRTSWLSIGFVALLSCIVIQVLKFTPPVFHNYVIGRNVKGSVMNVYNIFLGGALEKVPQSSFPRFLLLSLLMFTLVIRTLYLGQVFDLLKNDVRTIQLKTIDDYVQHKFTFYIYQSLAERLQGSKYAEGHTTILGAMRQTYQNKTLDPAYKGVVFNYLIPVLYENLLYKKQVAYRICSEVLMTNSMVFYFPKNFYLVKDFDFVIESFQSAGLIDRVLLKYVDTDSINTNEKQPPTALSYGNIEGFFILYYCGCFLALVAFVSEIIFAYMKRKKEYRRRLFES